MKYKVTQVWRNETPPLIQHETTHEFVSLSTQNHHIARSAMECFYDYEYVDGIIAENGHQDWLEDLETQELPNLIFKMYEVNGCWTYVVEPFVFTVNLVGMVNDLKSRILWQQLFNIYREYDGDLANMDNMLCDYNRCKRLFKNLKQNYKFVWALWDDNMNTDWVSELDWPRSDPKLAITTTTKCIYLCEVSSDKVIFIRLR